MILFPQKQARLFPKTGTSFQEITYMFFEKHKGAKTAHYKIYNKPA